ncbi:MAG: lysophospholipase [Anaerolineales bacterium]|nr:lysophospholipase [Anaerolineales bacterium]
MKQLEGYFLEHNQSIYYQYWLPESPPRAILLIVHGLNEHCGRYQHLAEYFTGAGFGVYGFDLIGHGKSDGTRSFVQNFATFTNPILTILDLITKQHPDLPIYLVGHSLGGLIGAKFLIDHQDKISGAILSGSLVSVPEYVSDLTIKIGTIISKIIPKFRLIGIDKSGLSRDPQVVANYINDPLVYNGKSTARISSVINDGISYVKEKGSTISRPILILHGGQDRICDPSWSTYLHNLVSSQQNQLIIYDELFHEIYNEPEQETVFKDVLNWLNGLSG